MSEIEVPPIRVEMIADLTCPWCYIGKRRLEAVVASFAGLSIDLHWRPYQLDPNLPRQGLDLSAYRAKWQNESDATAQQAAASQAAKDVGLSFAWDRITRIPNTRDAHRLVRHATLYGVEMKLVERLFQAYFCEGADIGNRAVLSGVAETCGIESHFSEALLASEEDALAIEEELAKTRLLALPNVPCFVLADEIVVPGDAPRDIFTAALFRAQALAAGPEEFQG
jgi:predicted DsbA family dithiol-disulfide isomerase